MLELDLWFLRDQGPWWLRAVVYAAFLIVVRCSRRRLRRVHGRTRTHRATPLRAWGESLACSAALSVGVLTAALALYREDETAELLVLFQPAGQFLGWLLNKGLGAAAQQALIHWFLWPICRDLVPHRAAALGLAAAIFGVLHLPSPTLVCVTACAALCWVGLYHRNGRLAPLIVSHVWLALMAYVALPDRLIYHLKVGSSASEECSYHARLDEPDARNLIRTYASPAYYAAQGGSDRDFVRSLYRDLAGRRATAEHLEFCTDLLRHQTRSKVVGALYYNTLPESECPR